MKQSTKGSRYWHAWKQITTGGLYSELVKNPINRKNENPIEKIAIHYREIKNYQMTI